MIYPIKSSPPYTEKGSPATPWKLKISIAFPDHSLAVSRVKTEYSVPLSLVTLGWFDCGCGHAKTEFDTLFEFGTVTSGS